MSVESPTPRDARPATTPWLRNAALTLQTVREHVVDDPVQLILQVSRRAPHRASHLIGRVLSRAGGLAGGVPAAIGHELLGDRPEAVQALEREAGATGSATSEVHRADAALGLGEPELAARLLDRVAPRRRAAPWAASAARLAAYNGDLDAAVEFAVRDDRNRNLARRMIGERDAFRSSPIRVPPVTARPPVPGRIMHVLTNSLPYTGSGYAQRSHSILRSLTDLGFDVGAMTRPGYPVQIGVPWAGIQDTVDGITYHRLLPGRLAQGQADRLDQHARLLSEAVHRFRPALLHTTTHFTNGVVTDAVARAHGIPWVYEVRGQLADTWASTRGPGARDSERYRLFRQREAEVARRADAVVTLGEGMRDVLVGDGVDPERIVICPNAVGDVFLNPPKDQAQARRHLGLHEAEGTFVVGTVSSIVDYEGLDTLLRAVALLSPRLPGLRLHVAGDGVALPGLKTLARQLGIEGRCHFPGRVQREDAPWHHAALDVFVVPRRDLPVTRSVTPMKSVEASASARPVVASDLPALAELVDSGTTGLLVPAGDDRALAAALERLAGDPRERHRMGRAGRDWALQSRTWAGNAERYRDLYAGLGVHPTP
ncbi:glycosyltransferase family 4 protein [Microbacterium sp. A93]|uniref:glycosyltransferase family 4 protein n=1 Tax=Microbacterium sp. A93 TaxID=3450716 RepID=UPI003F423BC6